MLAGKRPVGFADGLRWVFAHEPSLLFSYARSRLFVTELCFLCKGLWKKREQVANLPTAFAAGANAISRMYDRGGINGTQG